jgi:predicted dehydrogenase
MMNVAVIGPGRMGKNYLRVLSEDSRINIASICGNDLARTEAIAKTYGAIAHAHGNVAESLSASIDLIIISSSEWVHEDALSAALNYDVPIIIEKPLLPDWASAQRLWKRLKTHTKPILPCFTSRFDLRYVEAKEKTRSHIPSLIHSRRNCDARTASRVFGKIPMSSWIICHDVDLMRWFSGSEVQSVRATSSAPLNGFQEKDFIVAELRMQNGALCTIENSWLSPDGEPRLCEDFRFLSRSGSYELVMNDGKNYDFFEEKARLEGNTPRMIRHFIAATMREETSRVTLLDALENMRVCEAIRRSVMENRTVEMSEVVANEN